MESKIWYDCLCFFCFFFNHILLGDIVHLQGIGQSIIILNSKQAINDLLEKRENIYSNCSHYTVVGEMMGVDRVSSNITSKKGKEKNLHLTILLGDAITTV